MRIAQNIELLVISVSRGGMTSEINLTLAWDENHLVLFDTGYPDTVALIADAIKKAGFNVADLTEIILTHQDIDHIGGCKELKEMAPTAKILASSVATPYIDGHKMPTKLYDLNHAQRTLTPQQQSFLEMLEAGFLNRQVMIDQELQNNELIDICGGIRCIATPGHTPGHMSFFLEATQVMVCGDAANVKDGKLVGPNPNMTKDIVEGEKSLAKLMTYPMKIAVCYHTGVLNF